MELRFEDFFVHYFLNTTNASILKLHGEVIEYETDFFFFLCVLIQAMVGCLLLALIIVVNFAKWIDLTCSKKFKKPNDTIDDLKSKKRITKTNGDKTDRTPNHLSIQLNKVLKNSRILKFNLLIS